MREHLTTFIVVTLVTLTVWLFAEAESLGHQSMEVRIEIAAPDDSRMVSPAAGWDERATIEVSGSRSSLEKLREAASQPIRVALPVTVDEGDETVDLLAALQEQEALLRAGVTIETVRPGRATVVVKEMTTVQAPIRAELPGLQVAGAVAVTPDRAEVRLPKALATRLGPALAVIASVPDDARARLTQPGPAALQATLSLPDAVASEQGVQLLTTRASLAFSVRSTLTTASFTFPVQVLTLPVEWSDWKVQIAEGDERLTVDLTGPSDAVESLKGPDERLLAVLALTSDDLARQITTKPVSFGTLRAGVFSALPPGVEVKSDRRSVRFEVSRRGTP